MLKEIIKKFSKKEKIKPEMKEKIKPEIERITVQVTPDSPIGRWARKYNR